MKEVIEFHCQFHTATDILEKITDLLSEFKGKPMYFENCNVTDPKFEDHYFMYVSDGPIDPVEKDVALKKKVDETETVDW